MESSPSLQLIHFGGLAFLSLFLAFHSFSLLLFDFNSPFILGTQQIRHMKERDVVAPMKVVFVSEWILKGKWKMKIMKENSCDLMVCLEFYAYYLSPSLIEWMLEVPWLAVELREWIASTRSTFHCLLRHILIWKKQSLSVSSVCWIPDVLEEI